MKYYIIAGEASGDLHGSNLMKGLYARDPEADIRFWGGNLMNEVYKSNQSGEGLVQDYKDGAVIGFVQVLFKARAYAGRFKRCFADILEWQPDAVILIDFPGFNFRVAEFAHKQGFRVFYYIAPKVWASRESRVKKIKAYVDKLFIVFPFEIPYFTSKGVAFIYKGNPLLDAVDNSPMMKQGREEFLKSNHLEDRPSIALLAGSRNGEISSMMPTFAEFADRLRKIPGYTDYQFIIAAAPARSMDDYSKWTEGREDYLKVVFNQSYAVIRHSVAAVVNSGTASLETALIGTPQVVAYKGMRINFAIAKQIIKINFISLGNLILGRTCFRELIQDFFSADNVVNEVRRLIEDNEYRDTMLAGYEEIRNSLGGRGASEAVADAMIAELKKG
ncbi:MAG: lipid-A-disaccharide synthase [Candidatus Cryptobacteroides sp.]|nr:lipid-A-disaccharide synthase [Candidatus Cryptobacteroides sp.]